MSQTSCVLFQEKNPFSVMSEEDLSQIDAVLSTEEGKLILQQTGAREFKMEDDMGEPHFSAMSGENSHTRGFCLIFTDITGSGYPLHRENRENGKKKKSLSGKTQGIWTFCENTGNLVCSSCKFPDSKGKKFSIFAAIFFLKAGCLPSQFGVCNSHKSRKLAQVPCMYFPGLDLDIFFFTRT